MIKPINVDKLVDKLCDTF